MIDPVVQLRSGFVRGIVEKHEDGFDYYAFKGIPYGEPPIGELRFKDPLPIRKWTGTIDCINYAQPCLQTDYFTQVTSYKEDCLHINVFTHSINVSKVKNPVIVVIHGGGYMFESSSDMYLGPDYLIRKDIVLVTFNYRLGVLGFLDLEDQIAPGNQGLKDQVLAFTWVQENIKAFGGDPNNVTAFGITGGGSAAHYLAISPLGKGLFHKVISHSCTAFNPWVAVSHPKSNAIELCSILGKNLTDSKKVFKFLQTVDAKLLQEAQEKLRMSKDHFPFGPGVDKKSSNPFMPIHRDIAANEAVHLPYLLGHTTHPGLFFLKEEIILHEKSRDDIFKMCDENFEFIKVCNGQDVLKRHQLNPKQLRRFYFKSEVASMKNLDKFVELTSDIYFIEGIHKLARIQSERSSASTYLYVFSYDSPNSLSKTILKDTPSGVIHIDDVPYYFKMGLLEQLGMKKHLKKDSQDYKIMEQMTEMWANFAKHGRPTIETSELIPVHWKPITDGTILRYLNIDEDTTMKVYMNIEHKFLSAKSIKA